MTTHARLDAAFSKPDALAELARALLEVDIGERIPTVQELQASIGVGSGTVVKALRTLEQSGAVTVEARGHLGTSIRSRDLGQLWNAARRGNLHVLLTPPGPVEQHGLAAAIRAAMTELGVAVVLHYVPGASRRLKELMAGRVQAVTTSRAAYLRHQRRLRETTAIDLGPRTYYASDSIVVVQRKRLKRASPVRVGIDRNSDDHRMLTELEFTESPDVKFVDCSFVEGPALILQDRIDAVVWHQLPTLIPPQLAGLDARPIRADPESRQLDDLSRALLVVRTDDRAPGAILGAVTPKLVRAHQRRVTLAVGESQLPHEALWLD